MSVKNIKKLIISAFAAIFLVSGVIATTAEAQDKSQRRPHRPRRIIIYRPYNPFWYRYDPFWDPFRYDYRVVDPIAYQRERGYSEGKDEGEDDAKKGIAANPTGHKDYLKSDSKAFREAFIEGYNDGYREEMAEIREKQRERRGE